MPTFKDLANLIKKRKIKDVKETLSKHPELGTEKNEAGNTAPIIAAKTHQCSADLINALFPEAQSEINTADPEGHSPLIWASIKGQAIPAIEALLNANADATLKDVSGMTALAHAQASSKPNGAAIVELLEKHKTSPEQQKFCCELVEVIKLEGEAQHAMLQAIHKGISNKPELDTFMLNSTDFMTFLCTVLTEPAASADLTAQQLTLDLMNDLFKNKEKRASRQATPHVEPIVQSTTELVTATKHATLIEKGICVLINATHKLKRGLAQITSAQPEIVTKLVAICEQHPAFQHQTLGLISNLTSQTINVQSLRKNPEAMTQLFKNTHNAFDMECCKPSLETIVNRTSILLCNLAYHCNDLTLLEIAGKPHALVVLSRGLASHHDETSHLSLNAINQLIINSFLCIENDLLELPKADGFEILLKTLNDCCRIKINRNREYRELFQFFSNPSETQKSTESPIFKKTASGGIALAMP